MRERVVVRNTFRFWGGGKVYLGYMYREYFRAHGCRGLVDHCTKSLYTYRYHHGRHRLIVIVSIVIIIIGLATMLIEKSLLLYQICGARCPK